METLKNKNTEAFMDFFPRRISIRHHYFGGSAYGSGTIHGHQN